MSEGKESTTTRPTGVTYHLTPDEVWRRQEAALFYEPEAYSADGFVHCTDGQDNLLRIATLLYQADDRPHVVLDVDLDRVTAPARYEDSAEIYPHVYGPIDRQAIVAVRRAVRLADGSFVGIE